MKRANPYPGVHPSPRTLADGRRVTYYYAWKSGPRIDAPYGSAEFARQFAELTASRAPRPAGGVLLTLFNAYQHSRGQSRRAKGFLDLSERTRADYAKIIARLERKFGDFPLAALDDPGARAVFLEWRDKRAEIAPRRADYEFTVLARILAWALDRRLIRTNPCERAGRVWSGTRAEHIWSDEDEAAFMRTASPQLRLALTLALWTGQRQGDLLRLPWSAYDGEAIRLRQSKTGAHVTIPAGTPLRAALEAAPRVSPLILTNAAGVPWTPDGFRSSWRKAQQRAGVSGVTFNDLRGTAVTRLRGVGCSHAEIGSITGHKNAEITAILEKHYAATDPALARAAIAKLETRTKVPNQSPNRHGGANVREGKT